MSTSAGVDQEEMKRRFTEVLAEETRLNPALDKEECVARALKRVQLEN